MNKLIVAEKPSVAVRIAMSLGDSSPKTESVNGIRYFVITRGQDKIFITSAAGHLFTLTQTTQNKIPVFDIEWIPSYKVNKGAYFTKKYLDAIEAVGKQCSFFINACDYDIEGTVIGTNIIKMLVNKNVNSELKSQDVKRMRFSTTTNDDLIESYNNLNDFDRTNFDAGETRHKLDWMWGINMSRALMRAIASKGIHKTLSIGRVQGPTLSILAKREIEIRNFVSKPYWKLVITAKGVDFESREKEIFDKTAADQLYARTRDSAAKVISVEADQKVGRPFPPFDLTSLQLEASRVFHIDPSRTLAIAQTLYERSYISYPRTSSQKLPATLNLPRVITALQKNPEYSDIAAALIKGSRFKPAEGAKEDAAHPAIYPTGEQPVRMTDEETRVYDIIARRFLACFGEYSKSEQRKVSIAVSGDEYRASGETTTFRGWIDAYKYFAPKELELPDFKVGEEMKPDKVDLKSLKTLPPKRYTKAGLISLLESRDLGTKATRAEIIDTLFRREYIKGTSIEVTGFGLSVYNALSIYCANILDEDMTRKLEKDMERIEKGTETKDAVISQGKKIITDLVGDFNKKEGDIGNELLKGLKESQSASIIGTCSCGGNLILRKSKAGKNFIGCSNWPKCTKTFSVPQGALIKPTGKVCELCKTPIIKVFRKGKGVFQMDLDPSCKTKESWNKPKDEDAKDDGEVVPKPASAINVSAATPAAGINAAAPEAPMQPAKAAPKPKTATKKKVAAPKKRASRKAKPEPTEMN